MKALIKIAGTKDYLAKVKKHYNRRPNFIKNTIADHKLIGSTSTGGLKKTLKRAKARSKFKNNQAKKLVSLAYGRDR